MARLAVELHERGFTDREVIRECYGVEFPDEFFVIAGADRLKLGVEWTNLPWELVIPPERGGPADDPYPPWDMELWAFGLDPRLVPLGEPDDDDAVHGGFLACYHLDELAEGRSTVFGLEIRYTWEGDDRVYEDTETVRMGDSLLEVLREYEIDRQRMIQSQHDDPSNRSGFGYISREYVQGRRVHLERVEALIRVLNEG
jgi:hypothetical protein